MVSAERKNASAELLATWLENRLGIPVQRKLTRGPGITGVRLVTRRGEIAIARSDGRLATLLRTSQPDRAVALPRRSTDELLAEELRRLDPDDVYNETIQRVFGADPKNGTGRSGHGRRLEHRPAPARKSASAKAADVADTPVARRGHRTTVGADMAVGRETAARVSAGKAAPSKATAGKATASKARGSEPGPGVRSKE